LAGDRRFMDVSVHTRARVSGAGHGWVYVEARDTWNDDPDALGTNVYAGVGIDWQGNQLVELGGNTGSGSMSQMRRTTSLNIHENDVHLQLDVVGDTANLFAWEHGEDKPETPLLIRTLEPSQMVVGLAGLSYSQLRPSAHPTNQLNTASFRFVEVVPEPLLGDVNLDGEVNGLDVDPFVDVLLSGSYQTEADMNEDQVVNGLDVDPFVAVVVGGVQQIPEPSTLLLALVALGGVVGWRKWGGCAIRSSSLCGRTRRWHAAGRAGCTRRPLFFDSFRRKRRNRMNVADLRGNCCRTFAVGLAACLLAVTVVPLQDLAAKDKDEGKGQSRHSLDEELREALSDQGVYLPDSGLPHVPNADLLLLGQALFFDHELSGNRDIACATCHHPVLATGDLLSLPIGTGAMITGALGPLRKKGPGRSFIPRNAPEVFNRGSSLWISQFWDSRVADDGTGGFISPAGGDLPTGLPNVLAVQAMFPVISRDEMRGSVADGNELALLDDDDLHGIWGTLMVRLLAIPGYRTLFSNAYGIDDQDLDDAGLGFEHAATAIAAFEAEAFTFLDSPFDKYLGGKNHALSTPEKRGALLFYGKAKCSQCHAGPLITDQHHYNLLVPHLGPGKVADASAPVDPGRALVTGEAADEFRFRTPPLRNVEVTGPYMHNGAHTDLKAAVRHHLDVIAAFDAYDPADHLDQVELIDTVRYTEVGGSVPDLEPTDLSKREFKDLMKFLESLTAPRLEQRLQATIPDSVPSGIPMDVF
jgi:cytochrome c peroxidase